MEGPEEEEKKVVEKANVAKWNCSRAGCMQILNLVSFHVEATEEEQGSMATTCRALGDTGRGV